MAKSHTLSASRDRRATEARRQSPARVSDGRLLILRWDLPLPPCDGCLEYRQQWKGVFLRDGIQPDVHDVGQREELADLRFTGPSGDVQYEQLHGGWPLFHRQQQYRAEFHGARSVPALSLVLYWRDEQHRHQRDGF